MSVPLDARQLMRNCLCFLVVYSNDVVFSGSDKALAIWSIIDGHHEITLLSAPPQLLACFGHVLENAPIGVGDQQHRVDRRQIFVIGPPPETVHRSYLFFAWVGIDLTDLVVCVHVEDAHLPITVARCQQRVLVAEAAHHQFRFLSQCRLHNELAFERYFLEYST